MPHNPTSCRHTSYRSGQVVPEQERGREQGREQGQVTDLELHVHSKVKKVEISTGRINASR